jgi:amino acid transporter
MITGSLVGAVSGVVILSPSVLAVFNATATSTWPNILISTAVILLMLVIAVVGIKITARTQVSLAAIEYTILLGFTIAGFVLVLTHHHGTFPITADWFKPSGIGGKGSLASGFLIAVFMYTGWDATVYVNEEVKHRRRNPGRAAVYAVGFLAIIYTASEMGLAGTVSPAKMQANSADILVYIANSIGGGWWAKVMALSLALSVIASTGVAIVVIARMVYGMASHRVLPPVLGNVNRRFATPAIASIVVGVILIAATWAYLLSTGLANVFSDVIDVTGLLYAAFYILTGFAAIVYYRRRVFSNAWDALLVGLLPLGSCAFLIWIIWKSLASAPASQVWSIVGIVVAGLILMFIARFVLRSTFFQIPRESATKEA